MEEEEVKNITCYNIIRLHIYKLYYMAEVMNSDAKYFMNFTFLY